MRISKISLIIILFSVTSCNYVQSYKNDSWVKREEQGPTIEYSYSVIKNKQSNSYIGILKKQDLLKSIVANSGLEYPRTLISIQYENNKNIEYIKITEEKLENDKPYTNILIIKKDGEEWKLENVHK